jgi:predicted nuclease with TOPRIM domain
MSDRRACDKHFLVYDYWEHCPLCQAEEKIRRLEAETSELKDTVTYLLQKVQRLEEERNPYGPEADEFDPSQFGHCIADMAAFDDPEDSGGFWQREGF